MTITRVRRAGVSAAPILPALVLLAGLLSPGAAAGVEISVDAETLSALLETMLPTEVQVRITEDRGLTVGLDDLRVTGFDPSAGENGEGYIRTSLQLKIPELGLELPVEPKLSLHLADASGKSVCFLRFEEVMIPLPLTGPMNIAPVLPRIPIPADETTRVQGQRGIFDVRTRLVEARLGSRALRLGFDLEVTPSAAPPSQPAPATP